MKTAGLVLLGLLLLLLVVAFGGWLALRAPDTPWAVLEKRFVRPSSRFTEIAGGIRIHWLDTGRRDAPPIVLIHGGGDNSFNWDGWARVLGASHRVIAIDLPGHGLTRAPADFVANPRDFADVVDRWAQAAGIPRFAVAGNSLGGNTAWQLAVRHPNRVAALVLVDAAGWPATTMVKDVPLAFRIMRYRAGRAVMATLDNKPLTRAGLRADVVDKSLITDRFVDDWAAFQLAPGHRPILMSMRPGDPPASKALLAGITAPTLILWGAEDPIVGIAAAHLFNEAIPGSQLIVYPHVGHLPQIEVPARSAGDVAAFLARHPHS